MTATLAVLGPLEINGQPEVLRSRGARGLLELLALRTGRTLSVSGIMDALWGEFPPGTANKIIQGHVSHLRRALGRDQIETVGHGYRLRIPREEIDASEFEDLAADGRRYLASNSPNEALDALDRAINLWRGDPIPDLAIEEVGVAMATRLRELQLNAEEDRFDALLALAAHDPLVGELTHAVAAEPFRERRRGQLMLALYRSGRQTEALRAFQDFRKTLAGLGIEPSAKLTTLEQAILLNSSELDMTPVPVTRGALRHHVAEIPTLPSAVSRFIGRQEELNAIRNQLEHSRLVTLTGAGGSGKTRLAIEAAQRGMGLYRDGTFFVRLASVAKGTADGESEEETVSKLIAEAIGLSPDDRLNRKSKTEALSAALAGQDALLIFDNCEHMIMGCSRVAAELLRRSPSLRILATSREPLGIDGEQQFKVRGLSVPQENASLARDLRDCESVELFVDRTRSCGVPITVMNSNARLLSALTRRLDGLPLALELAAARMPSMSLAEIVGHLDARFRLLAHGRRDVDERLRTLWSAIEWSYELLSLPERTMFRRLSVFTGGFDLQAARVVCAFDDASPEVVEDLIGALVDKNLIEVQLLPKNLRYRMLESIREFGTRQLEADCEGSTPGCSELSTVTNRFMDYYLALLDTSDSLVHGDGDLYKNALRELDRDNVRSVASGLLADRARGSDFVRFVIGMRPWWFFHRAETTTWIRVALQVPPTQLHVRLRTELLAFAAEVLVRSDVDEANRCAEECIELALEISEPRLLVRAYYGLTKVETVGWPLSGMESVEHLVALAQGLGDQLLLAECLSFAALVAVSTVPQQASTYIDELVEIAEKEHFSSHLWDIQLVISSYQHSLGNKCAALESVDRYLATIATLGGEIEKLGIRTLPLLSRGFIQLDLGEVGTAAGSFAEALWLSHRHMILSEMSYAGLGLAECAHVVDDSRRAVFLLTFADRQLAQLGQSWRHPIERRRQKLLDQLKSFEPRFDWQDDFSDLADPSHVVDYVLDWGLVQTA